LGLQLDPKAYYKCNNYSYSYCIHLEQTFINNFKVYVIYTKFGKYLFIKGFPESFLMG